MGAEFYGESYKGNDEPIFGGIPFLIHTYDRRIRRRTMKKIAAVHIHQ